MQPNVPAVTWKLAAVSHSVTLHACGPIQQYYACFPVDQLKKKLVLVPTYIRKNPLLDYSIWS